MNRLIVTLLLFISVFNCFAGGDEETLDNIKQSKVIIKEFAGQLKMRLKAAIKEAGPGNALEVCNIAAPKIAMALAEKMNWDIGRTSLKIRNPNNVPDKWEENVLQQFEQRKLNGENISRLDYYENTAKGFRYMKAIPTQGLCLTCHGESIAGPVKNKLDQLYPDDKATNYRAGDIRGAFTLLKAQP